jgi:DNA-binding GntR family transcriptional regulator
MPVIARKRTRIVAALRRGDAHAAAHAIEVHLDAVMAEIVAFADAHPEVVA